MKMIINAGIGGETKQEVPMRMCVNGETRDMTEEEAILFFGSETVPEESEDDECSSI